MSQAQRSSLEGVNNYVPKMQAGGDLGQSLRQRVYLGPVVVTSAAAILSAQSIAAAVDTTTFALSASVIADRMGPFGRNIVVVASGAATSNVTVIGRDYLGQPMRESFTLNGTTSVTGLKAFKYVDRITAGVTAATTINVGYGTRFGLPYRTIGVEREYVDNVLAAAGTLAAPVFTDPQTATTGDPRGTYIPTTTPDGVKVIELDALFNNFVNASNNGGLHGIRHFNT